MAPRGPVLRDAPRHVAGRRVEVAGHPLEIGQGEFAGPGADMAFCVKTHDVQLVADPAASGENLIPGVVRGHAYLGSHRDYVVDIGQEVLVAAPASLALPAASRVMLRFSPERCRGLVR